MARIFDERVVAGIYMDRSIARLVRACEQYITDEQAKLAPDIRLIALLGDAVRLTREMTLMDDHIVEVTAALLDVQCALDQLRAGRGVRREEQLDRQAAWENEFLAHVTRWKEETLYCSSMARQMAHPSYQRLRELGKKRPEESVRLLLRELRDAPDYWFELLTDITGANPILEGHDFDAAVQAWLAWGTQHGLLAQVAVDTTGRKKVC